MMQENYTRSLKLVNTKAKSGNSEMMFPRFSNIGLSGMLVTFSDQLTEPANRAALAFRARLETEGWDGVEETSTSLTSVYIGFDPKHFSHAQMAIALRNLLDLEDWFTAPLLKNRKLWRIPTVYGGKLGPQLAEVAELAGLSPDAAIKQISSQRLRVLTIGFAPGQPYLGQLPPQWDIPRQSGLTPKVPAGALVTAIRQLILFTAKAPTGWRHIGQTEFRGFRPESDAPFILRPGDEVIFHSVDEESYANIRANNAHGNGGAVWEKIR
jgi:KipI family sensor histidine kinase inhibitor